MHPNWHMLTLIGEDRPGIVAAVTEALYARGLNLGETSMLRLGGNFTIMMMVSGADDGDGLRQALEPVIAPWGMCLHVDPIGGGLHQHLLPNLQVTVSGADRAGIVAQVTGVLAAQHCNILDLESDVAGSDEQPVYIMQITCVSETPLETVDAALEPLRDQGVDVRVHPIETYIG